MTPPCTMLSTPTSAFDPITTPPRWGMRTLFPASSRTKPKPAWPSTLLAPMMESAPIPTRGKGRTPGRPPEAHLVARAVTHEAEAGVAQHAVGADDGVRADLHARKDPHPGLHDGTASDP